MTTNQASTYPNNHQPQATIQNMQNANLLKTSLYADTIFTTISGLGLVIFNTAITSFLGWSIAWVVPTLGIVFLFFAAYLFMAAKASPPNTFMVKTIIAVAVLWVVESSILLFLPATNPLALSTGGKWAVVILADIVFIFGLTQFLGLRRLKAVK